jgi:hypothetical protein
MIDSILINSKPITIRDLAKNSTETMPNAKLVSGSSILVNANRMQDYQVKPLVV